MTNKGFFFWVYFRSHFFWTASNKYNLYHEIKPCIFPLQLLQIFSKVHCLLLSFIHNKFIHRTLQQVSGSVFNFPLWFNKSHAIIASFWSSLRRFNFLSRGPVEQLSLSLVYKIRMKPAQMVLFWTNFLKKVTHETVLCKYAICKAICLFGFVFLYKPRIHIWTTSYVIKPGSITVGVYSHIGWWVVW